MSTNYRPLGRVVASDLLDGRLLAYGIKEHRNREGQLCLYDTMNYLHVHVDDEGLSSFTRYAGNNASYIVGSISEAFGVRIVSEYEPEYWGFATEAEWDAWQETISREHEDEFYVDLIRYVKGEPNGIRRGTIGNTEAEIAKQLIAAEPGLIEPSMREVLMARVRERYRDEHTFSVKIDTVALREWFERTADPYGTRDKTH
jgi:hypothetical protein